MSIHEQSFLVIDTASSSGIVMAVDGTHIYAEVLLSEKMMHGALISDAILSVLAELEGQHKKLSGILVGRGPGSFVGIRIALATALGFSFARALPLVGFCSHRALACTQTPSSKIAVVMKASGSWCYMTHYVKEGDELIETKAPHEILQESVLMSLERNSCIISDLSFDNDTLKDCGVSLIGCKGPQGLSVHQSLKPFFKSASVIDESDIIKPNYVRAPSVTMAPSGR